MSDEFLDYLDRWLQDQGTIMHMTTLERIEDGAEEFFKGDRRSFSEWMDAPRDASNHPISNGPNHTRAGDQMQSALSRIIEFVDGHMRAGHDVPYEVRMAVLEGEDAINEWTEARRADAR